MADCLNEMEDVQVWRGDTRQVLQERGIGQVITQNTPNLAIKELLQPYTPKWQPESVLVNAKFSEQRLKRFSRYWEKAGPLLLDDAVQRKS